MPLYDQEDMQRIEETRVLPEQSHLCMTKMGAKLRANEPPEHGGGGGGGWVGSGG